MMRRLLLAIAALFMVPLTACATLGIPSSPSVLADGTKMDEQAGIALNLAYTAAAKGAALAIRTGIVSDPATIKRIGELNRFAFAKLTALNAAYNAGNASSYLVALSEAKVAVNAFVAVTP